jgi:hypothetical protein
MLEWNTRNYSILLKISSLKFMQLKNEMSKNLSLMVVGGASIFHCFCRLFCLTGLVALVFAGLNKLILTT